MPNQTEARQHRGRWTELQVPKLENGEILSGLENPTDQGAWWATVQGVAKSRT